MPVTSTCPVCGDNNSRLFLDGEDRLDICSVGSSRSLLSPGRILRCNKCRLAFRSFRPTIDELGQLYRDADDSIYEAELANRFRTAERHRRIVARYQRLPGSMIDVGCASGAFLRVMADAGWKVTGVEPSASQCARARKVLENRGEIKEEVLERAELPQGVDLVTMWDVLEHVGDPVSFLSGGSDLLRKEGLLILNVPFIDSVLARSLKSKWPLLLAEHLNYFTAQSLRLCASKANLDVIALGHRPVSFSMGYVLYRLSQHGLPGAKAISTLLKSTRMDALSVPIWMGEIYAVCRRK